MYLLPLSSKENLKHHVCLLPLSPRGTSKHHVCLLFSSVSAVRYVAQGRTYWCPRLPLTTTIDISAAHHAPSVVFASSLLFVPPHAPVSALYNTALTFDPPVAGYPTEITFTFTPIYGISAG